VFEYARPDQAGVAHEFQHDVLGEDAPPFTSPPFQHRVDDRDRKHNDDHTRGKAGQQRVTDPERSFQDVRDDCPGHRQESDEGDHPRATQVRADGLRASRPDVASHLIASVFEDRDVTAITESSGEDRWRETTSCAYLQLDNEGTAAPLEVRWCDARGMAEERAHAPSQS
jgi:hypothetical protein